MVVLAIARVLLALVAAALMFPWVMRRWVLRLLLFSAIVYVGLPIQADQNVFWTSGYTVLAQLKLKGSESRTLVLTRYQGQQIVLICEDYQPG